MDDARPGRRPAIGWAGSSWPVTQRIGSHPPADSDSTPGVVDVHIWPWKLAWVVARAAPVRLCWTPMSRNAVRLASPRPAIRWRTSRGCSKSLLHWVYRDERYVCCLEPSPLSRNGYRGDRYAQSSAGSRVGDISGSAWPSRQAAWVGGYGAGLRRPSPDRVRTTEVGDATSGSQYRCGAVMDDGMSPPRADPEF